MSTLNNGNSQPNDPTDPIYCGFVAGQHVVCIRDDFMRTRELKKLWEGRGVRFPVRGTVYTVRTVFVVHNEALILVAEITNKPLPTRDNKSSVEPGFPASYFRPLKKLRAEDFRSGDAPIDHRVLEGVGA